MADVVVFTNVSAILPVPLDAALLIPVTAALLHENIVPAVELVAVYENGVPLVAVAERLLDKTGIGLTVRAQHQNLPRPHCLSIPHGIVCHYQRSLSQTSMYRP